MESHEEFISKSAARQSIMREAPHLAYAVDRVPAADVAPVVRCKDCKHAHMTTDGDCKYCDMWDSDDALYLHGLFFCAYGERKG